MAPATKKDSAEERIGKLIQDKIEEALSGRDRKEAESKDPWARIEGIIDRAVGKHFEEFAKGLADEEGGAKRNENDEEGESPKLGIFGL